MERAARRLVLFGVTTIGLLALAACGGEGPTPTTAPVAEPTPTPDVVESGDQAGEVPVVPVSGTEYSFGAMEFTTAAGRTTLRFTNEGQEVHELQIMRFNEGVLIHQFMGTLFQGEGLEAALRMVTPVNHVATIGPGQTAEGTVDLPEGKYLFICQVPSPGDGVAHVLKGMAAALTVTAAR